MTSILDQIDEFSKAEKLAILDEQFLNLAGNSTVDCLSVAQQHLWFQHQLTSSHTLCNSVVAWRLEGQLNVSALERGLAQIVHRHEVLHTQFPLRKGKPVPVVSDPADFKVTVLELPRELATHMETELQHWLSVEAQKTFDLAVQLPFRASLLVLGENEYVLALVAHDIVWDEWSASVFAWELGSLYDAFATGEPSPLQPLPIQYSKFSNWQAKQLDDDRLKGQLAYWRERLGAEPLHFRLLTDRPHSSVQTDTVSRQYLRISRNIVCGLEQLAEQEGTTLYTVLLAAFNVLLWRYTAQEDIVVGSPVAGRIGREVEGLIGRFANTLLIRTDLAGDPGFRFLLKREHEIVLGAQAHQDLPIEKLMRNFFLAVNRNVTHCFRSCLSCAIRLRSP